MKKLLAIFTALCLLMLSGCKKDNEEKNEPNVGIKPREAVMVEGGTLNLSVRKPDTYNPICTEYESCRELLYLFYDPLFCITDDFTAEGNLAVSYQPSDDALSGTVKLKQGVAFSDGSAFTAEDVIYTVEFIREHPENYGGCVENIASLEAVGSDGVYITLSEPERHFETMLSFPIIKSGSEEYMAYPIGTGQFVSGAEDAGYTGLKCTRNAGYHKGRPYLEGFNVSFANTDLKVSSAFESGETDILINADAASIKRNDITVVCGKTNRFEFLGFNSQSEVFCNDEVRRAVYEAIGKTDFLSTFEKISKMSLTPINPDAWFYSQSELKGDEPKAILERNGWSMGASGAYEKNGQLLKFKILVNAESSERTALAKFISGVLIEYGISADVLTLDYEEYSEKIASGEYDAFIGGTAIGNAQNPGALIKTGAKSNVFGYSGGVTDLRLNALKASRDENAADEGKKFMKAFAENAPIVGLYFKIMYVAVRNDVTVPSLSPTGVFLTAYTWYMTK